MLTQLDVAKLERLKAEFDWESAYVAQVHSWTPSHEIEIDGRSATANPDALPVIRVALSVPDHVPAILDFVFFGTSCIEVDFLTELDPTLELTDGAVILKWNRHALEPSVTCRKAYYRWSHDIERLPSVVFVQDGILIDGVQVETA